MSRILIVDDDAADRERFDAYLEPEGHDLAFAGSGEDALEAVRQELPDVILLDIMTPGMDGFEVLAHLKADAWTQEVPVVVVTAYGAGSQRLKASSLGADDFLVKPIERVEVRTRVRTWLWLKHDRDQLERVDGVLMALAASVEARDPMLREHCARLARTVQALGQTFDLDTQDLRALRLGAYLHDIGKVGIPDAILLKSGPLDAAEMATMRTHPVIGDEILRPLYTLDAARPLVRHHHERLDGSGYPDGLRGEQIPLAVRILSVVDTFDVLTHPRPYRDAFSHAAAWTILDDGVERNHWDGEVVRRFKTVFGHRTGAAVRALLV